MVKNIKSNPYVYPYLPFENLGNKKTLDNFVEKEVISWSDLKREVSKLKVPEVRITGKSVEEKIISIFLDQNIRFGPREFISDEKKEWIKRLREFTERGEQIKFSLLGFPFKVPVPLKTDRRYPDMGDVLALKRLSQVNLLIKELYKSGAKTYVFTEGPFAKFTGVPLETVNGYMKYLAMLVKKLGFSKEISLIDLGEMEEIAGFNKGYKKKVTKFKNLYKQKDPEFLKKYKGAYDSIYRIVSTQEFDEKTLMDVYNDRLKETKVYPRVKKIREYIAKKTHKAIFNYYAYLSVRDDLNFIQKRVPGALPLSVSPKPGRLGIIQVNKNATRLPHHGVTVFYPKRNLYLIEYLIDIKRRKKKYSTVFLREDPDKKPFYYKELP